MGSSFSSSEESRTKFCRECRVIPKVCVGRVSLSLNCFVRPSPSSLRFLLFTAANKTVTVAAHRPRRSPPPTIPSPSPLQGRDRESLLYNSRERQKLPGSEIGAKHTALPLVKAESFPTAVLEASVAPSYAGMASPTVKINESEKMWHYQDPSGKQDECILLKDALTGKFSKESSMVDKTLPNTQMMHEHQSSSYTGRSHLVTQQGNEGQVGRRPAVDQNSGTWNSSNSTLGSSGQTTGGSRPSPLAVEVPKTPSNGWGSDAAHRNESTNLPSPTPQTTSVGTMGLLVAL
ncbi:hypothetical protein RIF29_29318 [Crotalaria pallida]|uniref:Uncharacterized protein n=1 Tax=Crotalaria pallida TaxID=3830 RepID=A0AAN9EEL1_CROPI